MGSVFLFLSRQTLIRTLVDLDLNPPVLTTPYYVSDCRLPHHPKSSVPLGPTIDPSLFVVTLPHLHVLVLTDRSSRTLVRLSIMGFIRYGYGNITHGDICVPPHIR